MDTLNGMPGGRRRLSHWRSRHTRTAQVLVGDAGGSHSPEPPLGTEGGLDRTTSVAAPRLTIALPVFNGQRYLDEAMESLLGQTYTDFELIIGDNASSDRTEEMSRAWARRDSRIRYVRNGRNIGLARNYMNLLHQAHGAFFRWAAVDDLLAPGAVAACVEVLERDAGVVLAYTQARLIDERGGIIRDYDDQLHLTSESPSDRFAQVLERIRLVNVTYGVLRRDALCRTHGLRSFHGADIALVAELALYGRFVEVPGRFFFRRFHQGASSALRVAEQEALFNPGKRPKADLRQWRQFLGLWEAGVRAPLTARERVRVLWHVLRLVRWNRNVLSRELWRALPFGHVSPSDSD
jgi:glycosyltransferase involved in cell wall biosynthesis